MTQGACAIPYYYHRHNFGFYNKLSIMKPKSNIKSREGPRVKRVDSESLECGIKWKNITDDLGPEAERSNLIMTYTLLAPIRIYLYVHSFPFLNKKGPSLSLMHARSCGDTVDVCLILFQCFVLDY